MLESNEKNLNVVCGYSGRRHRTPKYAGVFDGFKLEPPKMVRDRYYASKEDKKKGKKNF